MSFCASCKTGQRLGARRGNCVFAGAGDGDARTQHNQIPTPYMAAEWALPLAQGPHLFLGDYLIREQDHITRVVNSPRRFLDHPVVTGFSPDDPFKNFNYSVAVLYDTLTNNLRMWHIAFDPATTSRYTT